MKCLYVTTILLTLEKRVYPAIVHEKVVIVNV